MAAPLLNNPTNRLLGWSINDFSLYGAQPAVTIGLGAVSAPPSPFLSIPDPVEARAARVGPPGGTEDAATLASPTPAEDLAGPPPVAMAQPAAQPITMPVAAPVVAPSTLAPQAASPTGSGSIAPSAPIQQVGPVDHLPAAPATGVSTLSAPVLDFLTPAAAPVPVLAPAFDLATPLLSGAAAGSVAAAVPPAIDAVAQTGFVAANALTGEVQPLLDGAAGSLAGTLDHAAAVTASLDGLPPVLDGSVATVDALADDAVAGLATGVIDATTTLSGTEAGAGLAQVASDAVLAPLAETGSATTPSDGNAIQGSDPDAGISTLVTMVAASDPFELTSAGSTEVADAASTTIVDTLADEAGGSSLIGDAGHDGSTIDHLDDHGPGVLGGL